MPGTTYNGHGLRVDLVEKLRDLHPSFMRFPGGCIVAVSYTHLDVYKRQLSGCELSGNAGGGF